MTNTALTSHRNGVIMNLAHLVDDARIELARIAADDIYLTDNLRVLIYEQLPLALAELAARRRGQVQNTPLTPEQTQVVRDLGAKL